MKQSKKPLWGEHPNCTADYGADTVGSHARNSEDHYGLPDLEERK